MKVLLIYLFASDVIVMHEFSVLVVPPVLHELDQVLVPVGVGDSGRFGQAFNV